MMNALIALGLGIIIFALIAGVGMVVLQNFGQATANCASGFAYNSSTNSLCCNVTEIGKTCTLGANGTYNPSTATQTVNTTMGYITNNLITWIPAVIALGVGLLFIGSLMGKKKY